MTVLWPVGILIFIVTIILVAQHVTALQPIFRWLPTPLWCYLLPVIATACGWLPRDQVHQHTYRTLTDLLLPIALTLLLLGADLSTMLRTGGRALIAAIAGALGIMIGAPIGVWLLRAWLPPDAWKGAGTLAGTWTGGTMNLLALRSVLETPERVFAPLIIVDAIIAYTWMAFLVAISGLCRPVNRWLHAEEPTATSDVSTRAPARNTNRRSHLVLGAALALVIATASYALASALPKTQMVSSSSGWAVLLVTTATLCTALIPTVRRLGTETGIIGYPCLYLVLAATGAQASLEALWSAPLWVLLGFGVVIFHGALLLLAGRMFRIPLGTLATASQANIGGVVSAPLVGAVYDQSLAPVGLLLAIAGNALGTYLGLCSASFCRWLVRH